MLNKFVIATHTKRELQSGCRVQWNLAGVTGFGITIIGIYDNMRAEKPELKKEKRFVISTPFRIAADMFAEIPRQISEICGEGKTDLRKKSAKSLGMYLM